MKVEDVPQDPKFTEGTPVRHPVYAVNSEGKYQMVNSVGWEVKNEAIQLQLDAVQEECDEVLERIRKGESTLLEYYAVKNLMTVELLAHYADIPKRKVRKHMSDPEAFASLDEKTLSAYAEALRMTVEENGTISNLLRFYGVEVSEPMAFGLASGLFFVHMPIVKMGGMPMTAFRTFPGVLFKRITKLLGIKSEMRRFLSQDRAMKKLDEVLLGQKIPVGCVVGIYYLPYYPIEYRVHFNGHNICIVGKDEETGVYSVLDPVTTEKVTLSTKDLKKVRFTKGAYPLMGQMYWIKQMPEVMPDLKPLILKAIKKNCKNMAFQPDFIPFAGANGIVYLSKKIRTWEKTMGRKKALLNLAQIIRMLEETGTGGAGFRYVYGAFLQEAAEKTGLDFLNNYSAEMTQIGDMWREFSYQSSKILKSRKDNALTFDDLGDVLEKIGETERDFFKRLYADVNRCSE